MADSMQMAEDALFGRVASILEAARDHVSRSVNTVMVHAYWHIGREIVEHEQGGEARAEYGEQVIERLASRLTKTYGRGFGARTLGRMRKFYLVYPQGSRLADAVSVNPSTVLSKSGQREIPSAVLSESTKVAGALFPPDLAWSHYLVLMRQKNPDARTFYEVEAVRNCWSTRELERQVASFLFDRLAMSRDKDAVRALARDGQQVATPGDVVKDPFVLEFLGQDERSEWRERDLEQAIIDRLEHFLLELGRGFCFVARQRRITLEGDHFYVDLVFYNRLLRCFVILELKLGALTHQDMGQLQMYVNWFDRQEREEWENPTIGIVLCSEKNDAVVRMTLPEDNQQLFAARYQPHLPTIEELRREVVTERERLEQARRLLTAEE